MTQQLVHDVEAHDPDDQPARRRWRFTPSRAAVFVLPTVLFLALGVRPLEPLNGQDGYLYTAMVPRMYDFMNRFPDAYYGVRFGYTLPTWLATKLLGFEGGYLIVRWVAIGAICTVLTRSVRPRAALLATTLLATSPILLVAAFNTYTLSIGVLSFVAAATLLATARSEHPRLLLRVGCAGALLATTWNSHLVAVPISLVVGLLFVIDHVAHGCERRGRMAVRLAAALAVGAVLVTSIGIVVYGTQFGVWDLYGPSLDQARRPADSFYLDPGWNWISWRHYLWVGPIATIAGVLAWRTETEPTVRDVARRLTVFSTVCFGIFVCFQFLLDSPLLAIYFYSALPLALAVTCVAFSCAAVVNRPLPMANLQTASIGIAALLALVTAARVGGQFAVVTLLAVTASVLAVVCVVRSSQTAAIGMGLIVLAMSWTTVSSPHDFPGTPGGFRTDPYYDTVLFSYDWTMMDRAQLVDEFARALPSLPDERGAMSVWFDPAQPYDQLSAPLAWRRSALNTATDPGPPEVTESIRSALAVERPRYIVIIDGQQTDATLGAAGIIEVAPYAVAWQRQFTEGDLVAHVVLLERAPGTWPDFPCRSPEGLAGVCPLGS